MIRRVALVGALAFVAGACGGGPLVAPPPPDGVTVGGTATVALPRPASLDPGNVLDRTGEIVVRTMCDPLFEVDRETGEIIPSVAESWIVTDGGSRVVVRLRRGLRFTDGSPVTARDAVFALSRAASADFAGENAAFLSGIQGYSFLRGTEEAKEPRHRQEFSGIRITSETSFEINLEFGAQVVLPILTNPVSSPLSKKAAEADPEGFTSAPVCVGPYRPVEPFDQEASTFTVERVDDYGGSNEAFTGGGQGWLERITFRWTEAPSVDEPPVPGQPEVAPPALDEFDLVEFDPRERSGDAVPGGDRVVTTPSPYVQYVGVPERFGGAAVRRALSLALDREALAGVALGGAASPATGFFPPALGSRLYDPDGCGPDRVPTEPDVEQAREVLGEAGVDLAGQTLTIVTNPDFDNVDLVAAVARQWRQAFPNFRAVFEIMPWERYQFEFEEPDGFETAFRMSHHVPWAGADAWLRPFWTGNIGSTNAVAYSNGLLDRLLNLETAQAIDPVDQAILHREAHDLVCEDLPLIPLVADLRHYAVADGLASATGSLDDLADPVTGGLRLRDLFRP